MKALITKEVELKENHNSRSNTLKTLNFGDIVEVLKPRVSMYDIPWVYIQNKDGLKGYIKQEVMIEIESKYTLVVRKADIFSEPSNGSEIIFTLPNAAQLTVTDIESNDGGIWYKIRNSAGNEGYMNSSDEIELTRELQDSFSRGSGGIIEMIAKGGTSAGILLILYALFRLFFVYKRTETVSGFSVLLLCIGVTTITIGIIRKRIKKSYE